MGYMTYNPGRADGADHFVLVYGVNDNDEFLIHDPYGYPNVRLAAGELLEAWRAEKIDYKAKPFQYWHAPKRSNRTDAEQIRVGVWSFFHEMYAKIAELKQQGNTLLGAEGYQPCRRFFSSRQSGRVCRKVSDWFPVASSSQESQ